MRWLSSTFNSKPNTSRASKLGRSERLGLATAAATLVLLLGGDRLLFRAVFPLYDEWFKLQAVTDADIMLVGSSHIAFDIDRRVVALETGKKTALLSIPSASLLPRYYMIRERLRAPGPPPSLVILETSSQVFDPKRYSDDVAVPLIPYYHRGLFKEYVETYGPRSPDWVWRRASRLYSMNQTFKNFTDPLNVARWLAGSLFGEEGYERLKRFKRATLLPASCRPDDAELQARIASWKSVYQKNGADDIEPALVQKLKETVELVTAKGVRLILLDVPFFDFDDPKDAQRRVRVKAILDRFARESHGLVEHLSFDFKNDPCLFEDRAHLNLNGQAEFTKMLLSALGAKSV